jgi:hypothetical protein
MGVSASLIIHTAITPDVTHELLYDGATRDRQWNYLWVSTDADIEVIRDEASLP